MVRVYIALILLLVSGCSLLNQPDAGSPDAGTEVTTTDIPIDAVMDGGVDAGPDVPVGTESDCDNGVDEDMNGLTDCFDFACAGDDICCMLGDSIDRQWTDLGSEWNGHPTLPEFDGTRLRRFGSGVRAATTKDCVPLAQGVDIVVPMDARGMEPGDQVAFALTAVPGLPASMSLLEEVGFTLTPDGLTLTQADTIIAASPSLGSNETTVTIQLRPATELGEAVMTATASYTMGGEPVSLGKLSFPQANLLRTGSCRDLAGLYLGVEGTGDGVGFDTLVLERKTCANPSQFRTDVSRFDTLWSSSTAEGYVVDPESDAHEDMNLGDWASGGFGAPAVSVNPDGSGFELWVDGTDVDRTLGETSPIGFAIGRAARSYRTSPGAAWTSSDVVHGDPQPSCFPSGPNAGVEPCVYGNERDPAALTVNSVQVLAAASDMNTGTSAPKFQIQFRITSWENTPEFTLVPGAPGVEDCLDVREPALAKSSDSSYFWAFFSCREASGSSIRALRLLSGSRVPLDGDTSVFTIVDNTSSFSRGGVWSPEVVVHEGTGVSAGQNAFRLYFLARSSPAASPSLAMVQISEFEVEGRLPQLTSEADGVPVIVPYPANPILTEADVSTAGCRGSCDFTGFTAFREPLIESTSGIIFFMARRVHEDSGVRYELFPMSQSWRSPLPVL